MLKIRENLRNHLHIDTLFNIVLKLYRCFVPRLIKLKQITHLLPLRSNGCWFAPIPGDEIINIIRRDQSFETSEIQFVKSFLHSGQTFWDVGANFGLYTLTAAKRVGRKGTVLAIEPDRNNLSHLRINVFINRCWQVEILPMVLGEYEAEVDFWSCSQGAYSALKVAEVPGTIKKTKVRQTTLDTIANERNWPPVDLIKIDAEGAELYIFHGAIHFFTNYPRPILMCEFSDKRSCAYGYRTKQLYDWLGVLGYKWFSITRESRLVAQPPKNIYDYENLVAVPAEKLGSIRSFIGNT